MTILTGFLGSGKSTLVKHILTSPDHGRRIAIVENKFGGGGGGGGRGGDLLADWMGLSIETVIVRDGTLSSDSRGRRNLLPDLIKLPKGCVCCTVSVKDTLLVMLERLLETPADIHYVLLESIFWLDGALDSPPRLDGVV